MIYKSLHTLPMIVCEEILDTGNVRLLSTDPYPFLDLVELWETLEADLQKVANPAGEKRFLNVSKEIEFLANKYDIIHQCCATLRFDKVEAVLDVLSDYGYQLDQENYQKDLKRIERESQGIEVKIKQLQKTLPKVETNHEKTTVTDIMAGYSVMLGVSFKFNECTVTEFYGYEKQVSAKIKALEKQHEKT